MTTSAVSKAYGVLTSDDEGRVCRDIPESACRVQPQNFMRHVTALSLTKLGDGLVDPKLVLAWLMGAIGAPVYLTGALVPVREAGALLPQLFTAARIRSLRQRKWAWAAGSVVQGLCVLGIAAAALMMQGAAAGWAIVVLVALFALGRSVCSVSHKDVLGKTVSKSTRGTATGTAGTVAAAGVLAFGVLVGLGLVPLTVDVVALVLCLAGGCWLLAAAVFAGLAEEAGATEGGGNAFSVAVRQFGLLREDPQLVRFIAVRGLLTVTALAPPFLLALAGESDGGSSLGDLGRFVIASSIAALAGGYVWGRLSDRSSRKALMLAGALASLVFIASIAAERADLLGLPLVAPGLMFILMLSYQGVRLARSTHLTDMAKGDRRPAYTALSNTIIGIMLLLGGGFGLLAETMGLLAVFGLFALMGLVAVWLSAGLQEVQND